MAYYKFFDDLKPYNYSVNFGENVLFTSWDSAISSSAMYLFSEAENFNTPVTIPNSLRNTYDLFAYCPNFNSPVYIDPHHPNLKEMAYTFYQGCDNFNQNFNIPNGVYNFQYALYGAYNFQSHVNVYSQSGNWNGNPSSWDMAVNNFSYAFVGWEGNFNVHFIESTPVQMNCAFYGCHNLNQNIAIPSTVNNLNEAFAYCYNLNRNIRLPDNVVASGCFNYCYNLNRNIRIPNNSNITYMFRECYSLNQPLYVRLCSGEDEYNQYLNSNAIFLNCNHLNENVSFQSGYEVLSYTFANCTDFNYPITIPESVNNLYYTFYNCRSFNTQPAFPSSVDNMYGTFQLCYGLNFPMVLPSSVNNMISTFYGCQTLDSEIVLPDTVSVIDGCFQHCSNLNQNIQIPSSVISARQCFSNCSKLDQNIGLPDGIRDISGMFSGCNSLNQSIVIPDSVHYMKSSFNYCNNLRQPITLPLSVTAINECFQGCNNYRHPVVVGEYCNEIQSAFVVSQINNVTIQSRHMNFWTTTGGYGLRTITPFRFNYLNLDGFSSGDTVARVHLNKDTIYYNNYARTLTGGEVYNTEQIFFTNDAYLYNFIGISSGWVGGVSRTVNQAANYSDYQANYHDGRSSIWINTKNFEEKQIRFSCYDWANTSEGVTPIYNIFFNFI